MGRTSGRVWPRSSTRFGPLALPEKVDAAGEVEGRESGLKRLQKWLSQEPALRATQVTGKTLNFPPLHMHPPLCRIQAGVLTTVLHLCQCRAEHCVHWPCEVFIDRQTDILLPCEISTIMLPFTNWGTVVQEGDQFL